MGAQQSIFPEYEESRVNQIEAPLQSHHHTVDQLFSGNIHPDRLPLDAEFHSRPPLPLYGPTRVSHLAFLHDAAGGARFLKHLSDLLADGKWRTVESSEAYRLLEREGVRVRCELHTEFSSYTFFRPTDAAAGADDTALNALPADWLKAAPGQLVIATHIDLASAKTIEPEEKIAELSRHGRQAVVARVVDGLAYAFTDFQIVDGASNFLLIDCGLTPRQAGRTVQRLWEIETYRVMALLGLPVAKEIAFRLRGAEEQLANLMDRICSTGSVDDENEVLDELTKLAAEVEHSVARTSFRFSASRAYESIVLQRVGELRETRVMGFPTFREIIDRRMMPPMNTCAAMARRQDELSGRVARNSQLLRTRVDLALKRQNQQVLVQMNQRARSQLQLQETVEGLSIVAITYYGSQLVHYLAEGAHEYWKAISPGLITAISIPVIAIAVAMSLRHLRKRLENVAPEI
ncbi:DUF3422 domain-containing protein [soil metagenome]